MGDIHFASNKDYFVAIAEHLLDWFDCWEYNNESNELILAGDLVQVYINAGLVIEFLYQLIKESRFKKVHIIEGNHDKKLKDNRYQLAYSFLNHEPNVVIYDKATVVNIQDMVVLMLPYYVAQGNQIPMEEYYSSLYKEKEFQRHFDLLVGHFSQKGDLFVGSNGVDNLDKLDVDRICLGHIHTRIAPSKYIGSVYANRVNENAYDRAAWIIGKNFFKEDPLPLFNEFLTVRYPDPLPESKALVPIYTINNCDTDTIAKTLYGNIFIRKVSRDITSSSLVGEGISSGDVASYSIKDLFEEYLNSQETPIDDRIVQLCTSSLEKSTKYVDEQSRN